MKVYIKAVVIALIVVGVFLLLVHNNTYEVLWEDIKEGIFQTQKKEPVVHLTRQDGTKQELALEAYLEGVVGSEMPASYEMEALKAQCVAARTFVTQRDFQVDDTVSSQVYHDEAQQRQIWGDDYDYYHKRIQSAIEQTRGEIMTYEGEPISAVFFSTSCGKTANAHEYWNKETPYLRSVDSHWDKESDGFEQQAVFTAQEFANKLGFVHSITQLSAPAYYESGYVKSITIDGITFSGREIREKLGLRSSCFTIARENNQYTVTTKGYGHGIGMSQKGAQAMALEGKSYKEILKHYYQGIKIEK